MMKDLFQKQTATDVQWAWAAGLFEGEGCIIHVEYGRNTKNRGRVQRRLTLMMADRDVVERFAKVVGHGKVKLVTRAQENWSDMWHWQCSRWKHTERILRSMLPYLGERRSAKARELLADPAAPVGAPTGNSNAVDRRAIRIRRCPETLNAFEVYGGKPSDD